MMAKRRVAVWLAFGISALGGSALVAGCSKAPTMKPVSPTAAATSAPQPTAIDVPEVSSAIPLASSVTKATLYSDRARVTREATADISPEPTVLAFSKLPGWVDDGSVRVSASAGRIIDVRVERNFLAKPSDKNWQKAEADHKKLTRQLAALDDELAVLDAQKAQIEAIKAFSLEKITQDTTIGDVSVKSYGEVLDFITDSLRKTAEQRRAVVVRRDNLAPRVEASVRKLDEMKSLAKLEETTVLVSIQADAVTPTTLELTYMMPGVAWEPMHELRVDTSNGKTAEIISYAAVTQTSGEDWGNAELAFSTQSTVDSVRIPELEALTLGDTHTATRILTSQVSSFNRAQKAFEGQSQLWNKVHQRSTATRERFEQVYQSNLEYLQVVQSKTVRIFESLQKRGTTALFKAGSAPSVRGDGHPVRVRIGRSAMQSQQRIVAAPEQSLNAARTLAMINTTGQALLPGKVALYQDGAFVGMTDMDFIAESEQFSLFLGVADHLKLTRKLDRKHSSLLRQRRNRMQLSFIVTVENLSDAPTQLTLADRIPVSENKDIKISRVKIAPIAEPDSSGLLHWDLALKAKEKRQFRISYQVEYPAELVLDAARRRRSESPAPATDAPRKYRIEDDLMDLENQL